MLGSKEGEGEVVKGEGAVVVMEIRHDVCVEVGWERGRGGDEREAREFFVSDGCFRTQVFGLGFIVTAVESRLMMSETLKTETCTVQSFCFKSLTS